MDRTLDRTVFETPWFRLVERTVGNAPHPHYTLIPPDYVSVLALTDRNEVLLVRQFRPAVGAETLELPSGHVEAGQTPAMAALAELQEETGYTAGTLRELGTFLPDTGRLGNRLWAFFATDLQPLGHDKAAEEGLTPVRMPIGQLFDEMREGRFNHALNVAVLVSAHVRGLIRLPQDELD